MLDLDRRDETTPPRTDGTFGRAFKVVAGVLTALFVVPLAFCLGLPLLNLALGNVAGKLEDRLDAIEAEREAEQREAGR